jgi:hypothetical protein
MLRYGSFSKKAHKEKGIGTNMRIRPYPFLLVGLISLPG